MRRGGSPNATPGFCLGALCEDAHCCGSMDMEWLLFLSVYLVGRGGNQSLVTASRCPEMSAVLAPCRGEVVQCGVKFSTGQNIFGCWPFGPIFLWGSHARFPDLGVNLDVDFPEILV